MPRLNIVLALSALAMACAPPRAGPEAPVRALYVVTAENVSQLQITPISAIPMSDGLRALVTRAEAAARARREPFLEGDIAANCQDCRSLSDVVIAADEGPAVQHAAGHALIRASFRLNGEADRVVHYDMIQTPQGWRVDNILADGFDLRAEAEATLVEEPLAPALPLAP